MAATHHQVKESNLALEFYNKTPQVQQASLSSKHPEIARTFYSLGCFYKNTKNHTKTSEYYAKSFDIR
ncbi:unnamed protein product [Adineta steineri]|uniref:Tetratricopeptide repeat protein n=1 Tax=Adineta steineri TaxID=433720 RepID=A0A815L814_9BILA|nr:unnamed protein product [Adineta steineri]CAF3972734.1 unnamed protein product [Adineta steineri]